MRISIAGTEFTTATKGEQSLGLRISGDLTVQEKRLFRGDEVVTVDRGNKRTRFSFSVKREHASADAAETFMVSHSKAIHGKAGAMTILQDDGGAAGTVSAAAVVDYNGSYEGAQTTFSYEIIGGEFD